ncbi:MAG TPA: 50S ribosomal protein L11 methyltransferase [Candidatus Binatia bacterium]|nr:50S ribosomal protein L11 methyltransferase [Candidatus Binatia bacterium]
MPSAWLQVSIRADPSALDVIANFLIERGSPGAVLRKREVQGYFAVDGNTRRLCGDVQRFLRDLKKFYPGVNEKALRWRRVKERNWNRSWQKFFTPQRIGRRFLVSPPWQPPPPLRGRHLITIEPGLAFGTGTHATTRSCIEFLEKVVESPNRKSFDALDVGTGSGILSIALVKLGAQKVWAIDNDPVAVKVARQNLKVNKVGDKVRVSGTTLARIRRSFPLVVANLTAETILELAQALASKVGSGGFLILAGILYHKLPGVMQPFTVAGFYVLQRKREKEWVALLLRRS